ncbi:uncharacterized protein METZ01_LOCUS145444 [marine metagenome]|uniref:Uncharacterized protein n=1 Tax=marine metagenome TaxID=408172 RepID=A0A381ZTM9_9ZZZZ
MFNAETTTATLTLPKFVEVVKNNLMDLSKSSND